MPIHIEDRPKTWEEIVGNKGMVQALKSKIEEPERPHSYLFIGGSGTGKTTMARILANELGCSMEFDYYEYNMGNTRGIDTIRDINEQSRSLPVGSASFFLLDEVQQLTSPAQQALLKVLEDTPNHAYFCLCTTEPERLLNTIHTRCSTYKTSRLNGQEVRTLIQKSIDKRNKEVPVEVVSKIARLCDGSARNALKMLDQIIDLEPDQMIESIQAFVGAEKDIRELCVALLKKQGFMTSRKILEKILKESDAETIRRSILSYMTKGMMNAKSFEQAATLGALAEEFEKPFFNTGKDGLILAVFKASL